MIGIVLIECHEILAYIYISEYHLRDLLWKTEDEKKACAKIMSKYVYYHTVMDGKDIS